MRSLFHTIMGKGASAPAYPASLKNFIDPGNPASYSGSGTTVVDLTGTQNGTLINGVGYSAANGGVFVFDGINDYIDFTTNSAIQPNAARTISTWVFVELIGGNAMIYCGGDMVTQFKTVSTFHVNFANYLALGSDTATQYLTPGPMAKGAWINVTARFNCTTMQLYYNNVLQATAAQTVIPTTSSTVSVKLGAYNGVGYYLQGKIGVHKVYDEYRSTTDMTADFNEFKARYGY